MWQGHMNVYKLTWRHADFVYECSEEENIIQENAFYYFN